jgi:hypothetical protein
MKRTRHAPEQIVRKLREADRLLAESIPLAEVMRHLEISHQTYQRWRSCCGASDLVMWHDSKRWNKKTPG